MATNENFDLDLQDEDAEDFVVNFGEVTNASGGTSNFNDLSNRPKYDGQMMTGETDIPKAPTKTSDLTNDSDYQTGSEVDSAIDSAIGELNIVIGNSATSQNSNSIAIGRDSQTGANGSIAIGAYAKTTRVGEINVGSTSSSYGYNSTNYRVIGGIHDGQDAHDAVTVGQLNATIDAINTALSTNIPHIGA